MIFSPCQSCQQYKDMLKTCRNNLEWRGGRMWLLYPKDVWLAVLWSKNGRFRHFCIWLQYWIRPSIFHHKQLEVNPNCIIVTQPQPTPPRDAATSISLLNETRVSESQGNYDVWLKAFKNKQTIIQKQKWHARMPLLLRLHFSHLYYYITQSHDTHIEYSPDYHSTETRKTDS